MNEGSLLKRVYDGMALFALLNMVALASVGCYLLGTGTVNGEMLRGVVDVLKGGEVVDPDEAPEESDVPVSTVADVAGPEQIAMSSQVDLEILRREADRYKEELRQRLALNNSILLRVTAEREAFQQEQATVLARSRAERETRQSQGFAKGVEILEAMKPKVAMRHLLADGDLDEAAKILATMETRKAMSIVEAAKSPEDVNLMNRVMQRIRRRESGEPAKPAADGGA